MAKTIKATPLLLLRIILWYPVNSQTEFPYVSFMGETLPNHSYVDLSLVWTDTGNPGNTVRCHTDLSTCCSGSQGSHRGDWYFPDGTRLPFTGDGDIYEIRASQRVEIHRRNSVDSPSGIYRCDIPTNGNDVSKEIVYLGVYATGGDIEISSGMEFLVTSALDGPSPEFVLTCISTGGPATTVTWTRDSVTVTEGTETVLDDPVTAQYTHTLTGSTSGVYTCTMANRKPSTDSNTYTVQASQPPTNVMAVQKGPTSIRVSWTPSSGTTSYTISYTGEGNSVVVTVRDGSTDNYLLTGLQNGDTYNISIVATARGLFPSQRVVVMNVGLVPGQPTITIISKTSTSITISGSVPSGSVVTSYEVIWLRDTSVVCSEEDAGSTTIGGSFTSYEIMGLAEDSSYTITVRASNAAGAVSSAVTEMTSEAAPSGAPTSVSATSTSTTITVQWGPVNCIDRNGEITGYSVRYTGGGSTDTRSVTGGDVGQTTISGLTPSTQYTIGLAAVNSVGTGPYSLGIDEDTDDALVVSSVDPSLANSLTISWTLVDGWIATAYTISYSNTDTDCFTDSDDITGIAGSETMYTLTGLEEGTEYSVTVTATLRDGGTAEDSLTATTINAAPSAAPSSVSAISTSSTITVQWEMVPCIHQNGDITGYSVIYREVGSESTQIKHVSGNSVSMVTISSLMSSTNYYTKVAAVNSAGTGTYSDPTVLETQPNVYLSLNGDIIPNHGYVMISDIGFTDNTALICHTNNPPFHSGNSGGDWYLPDGTRVVGTDVQGLRRNRAPMIVRLLRNMYTDTPAEGIYHCAIDDDILVLQAMYVGLYNNGGGHVMVSGDMELTVTSKATSVQLKLTCISTGGPATTVTWTRDSETAVGNQKSVVNHEGTALYTHTLTVTGRQGGLYTCTVANAVSPGDSASLNVQVASAPTNVMAVQEGPTSIRVSWTPSSDATGYIISYTGNSSESVTVTDGSTGNYLLTGLVMETSYTISIAAISSQHLPSDTLVLDVKLISAPGHPSVKVTSITTTSISLSWSVPSGSVVTSSKVKWREDSNGSSERTSGRLTDTSYTIDQLESTTIYTITVTVSNAAGNTDSQPILISTSSTAADYFPVTTTAAIIGGVFITLALIVIVIVGTVLRMHKGCHSLNSQKRDLRPDVIKTSSNEAYHTVRHTGRGGRERRMDSEYEIVSVSQNVPPATAHSPQPTAGDSLYEIVHH